MLCLIMVIAGLVAGILISGIMRSNKNQNSETREYDTGLSDIIEKETKVSETVIESIGIPCFDAMGMTADTLEQEVSFYNPEKNTDIDFQISMYLVPDDDSQEEILLWKSGLIPNGKAIYNITLNQPLETGQYKARLQYDCFTKSGSQLNGCELGFNLFVQ